MSVRLCPYQCVLDLSVGLCPSRSVLHSSVRSSPFNCVLDCGQSGQGLSQGGLDLPAVPHRSTLSVCSKALLLNWESLLAETQQRNQIREAVTSTSSQQAFSYRLDAGSGFLSESRQPVSPPSCCFLFLSACFSCSGCLYKPSTVSRCKNLKLHLSCCLSFSPPNQERLPLTS